jgi:hypothetical protein
MGGERAIHYSTHDWYERCPTCGREPVKFNALREGPAAVELGFADPNKERPSDVRGCCSFTWAIDPETAQRRCADGEIVIDEYGCRMGGQAFLVMLNANCPIRFTDSIGEEFS